MHLNYSLFIIFAIVVPFHFQILPVPNCTFGTWQNCDVSLLDSVVPSAISFATSLAEGMVAHTCTSLPPFSHTPEVQGSGPGWAGDSATFITFLPADLTTLPSETLCSFQIKCTSAVASCPGWSQPVCCPISIPGSLLIPPLLFLSLPPFSFYPSLPRRAWTAVSQNTFSSRNDGRNPSTPSLFQ